MKILIIGGNRFVGLRLARALDGHHDLHILNRTGQAAHVKNATVYKGQRRNLAAAHLDTDWDVVFDFAAYDLEDIRTAIGFFKKVGRYVFISTGSVYDAGRNRPESFFDPKTWPKQEAPAGGDPHDLYQFGKRHAEAALTNEAHFPSLLVRFPFILGPDDYTHRLEFHVERIQKGRPLCIPNPNAEISMIHSEDAARFLEWSLKQDIAGPLNVASAQNIELKSLISLIEARAGRQALYINHRTPETLSPYAMDDDRSLSVKKLNELGFEARPRDLWLPDLIDSHLSLSAPRLH